MICFNVGSGKRNWKGWVSVDGEYYPHVTDHDVTLKYQPDNYIDLLYSSHLIAYFSRPDFIRILNTWYSKIKPGGIIRLSTPDFHILSKFYQVGLDLNLLLGPLYGKMAMNGDFIYHKTTYDIKALTALLEDAGFVDVRLYDHTKTEHPNTGNFDDEFDDCSSAYINGVLISINIEATKP